MGFPYLWGRMPRAMSQSKVEGDRSAGPKGGSLQCLKLRCWVVSPMRRCRLVQCDRVPRRRAAKLHRLHRKYNTEDPSRGPLGTVEARCVRSWPPLLQNSWFPGVPKSIYPMSLTALLTNRRVSISLGNNARKSYRSRAVDDRSAWPQGGLL